MTRDQHESGGQDEGAPLARIVPTDQAPAGFWVRSDHWPAPVTPLYADFELGTHLTQGYAAAAEELSAPTPPPDVLVVDGWVCFGAGGPPPPPPPERVAAFEEKVRGRHEERMLARWWEATRPEMEASLDRLQAVDLSRLAGETLLDQIGQISRHLTDWHAVSMPSARALARRLRQFTNFCRDRLDMPEADALRLLAGASPASSEAAVRLDQLAEEVGLRPDLLRALDSPDAWQAPAVRDLLQGFLDEYGHRSTDYEYAAPTTAERPERVVRLLRDAVVRCAGSHMGTAARVQAERAVVLAAVRGRLTDDAAGRAFDDLLAETEVMYGSRDRDQMVYLRATALMRYALLEGGRRLTSEGHLDRSEQVFFLRRSELERALRSRPAKDLAQRVAWRAADHQRQRSAAPPSAFGTPPPPGPRAALADDVREIISALAWVRDLALTPVGLVEAESGVLRGAGAAPGVYSGPARVVLHEDDLDRVRPGDVLVCPITTPAWTIVFGGIGALVTDEGGILSHPAIAAREFGIPAVVGTRMATRTIADGKRVEVDGSTGVVRL